MCASVQQNGLQQYIRIIFNIADNRVMEVPPDRPYNSPLIVRERKETFIFSKDLEGVGI